MAKQSYPHKEIEKKAQEKWETLSLHVTDLEANDPYYALFEFPYPSGDLHIGHWYAFAVTDIFARFKRAQGKNVLFPIGFDAFGLPAENAAIKNGADPAAWTLANMDRMRTQLKSMGASFDWSKEVATCSPDYYRWTQWLFTKLFEKGLAYRAEASVKWCPKDQTVLANEQVVDGHCERCGTAVIEKRLTQWFLKITDYAERLLQDLEPLPWRQDIKEAQRAWIGKSEGARLSFSFSAGQKAEVFTTRPDTIYGATYVVLAPEHSLIDELLETVPNSIEVREYLKLTARKTERERSENKEKTGVRLEGVTATNPATKEEIPVYVADYVLGSYGTGAVMGVPGHDERDFEFSKKYDLPIPQVIAPPFKQTTEPGIFRENEPVFVNDGVITLVKHWKDDTFLALKWKKVDWGTLLTGVVDEGFTPEETVLKEIREETGYMNAKAVRSLGVVDGLFYHVPKAINKHVHGHIFYAELTDDTREAIDPEEGAKHDIVWLTKEELKDFLTPDTHQYALRTFVQGYTPYGGSGSLIDSGPFTGRDSEEVTWEIAESVGGIRETQYRMRDWGVSRQRYWGCPIPIVYDPDGKAHPVPPEHLPWLLPTDVDFTPTGEASPLASSEELRERVERLFGKGWTPEFDTLDTFVDSSWYFTRYLDSKNDLQFSDPELMKKWLPVDRYSGGSEHTTMHLLYSRFFYKAMFDLGLVPTKEPFNERFNRGLILGPDGAKMSKSKGNVINPDDAVQQYGADAIRVYLAFIGPYSEPGHYPWKPESLASIRRFLDRIYALSGKVVDAERTGSEMRALASAAHRVASDLERFKTNTAVSALMILLNAFEDEESPSKESFNDLLVLLAPFAPHLAEHLYETLGGEGSIHQQSWPEFDPSLLVKETVVIGVQVAGKTRGSIEIAPEASQEEAVAAAMELPKVAGAFPGGKPGKVIYKPGRILNLVP
ncbi:MAG: leucyl-tRNA synthetase [Candidatus Parcubacteria bacterium]|jgi:leucyl-tRNA synthetase|nr:leucyl-tRNA synthetase [Candidatus Parcubacteria bacterium]